MARPVLLHIGYQKTATTSLQSNLFARFPGFANIGKPYGPPAPSGYAVREYVLFSSDAKFDLGELRRRVETAAHDVDPTDTRTAVISDEVYSAGLAAFRTVDRFNAALQNLKILVTIRRQPAVLELMYLYSYCQGGRAISFRNYLGMELGLRSQRFLFQYRYLDLCRHIAAKVGRSNLLILTQEELAAAPEAFFAQLGEFVGVDGATLQSLHESAQPRNERISRLGYFLARADHLLVPQAVRIVFRHIGPRARGNWLDRVKHAGQPARVSGTPAQMHQLQEFYALDNAQLASEFGLDLARWKYPLPASAETASGGVS